MMTGRLFLMKTLLDGFYFGTAESGALDVDAKALLANTHKIAVINVLIILCIKFGTKVGGECGYCNRRFPICEWGNP